jgi:hypothetical protein
VVQTKKISHYTIYVNLSKTHPNVLEVTIPLKWKQMNSTQFNELEKELKCQNIELRIGDIVKMYPIKKLFLDYHALTFNAAVSEFVAYTQAKG